MIMKVRVRKSYRDSGTGKIMRIGEEVEYESNRAKSLEASGFVSLLETQEDVEATELVSNGDNTTDKAKKEFDHSPEKDDKSGPGKRGRKPKD